MTVQERDKKITKLYTDGLSVMKIADMTGFHRSTVNNVVRKYGIARPGKKLGRDLTGKRFGKLTAMCVTRTYQRNGERYWLCQCECGTFKSIRIGSLISGDSRSCGCASSEYRRQSRKRTQGI